MFIFTGDDVCMLVELSLTILNFILTASNSLAFILLILAFRVRSVISTFGVDGANGGLLLKSYSFTADQVTSVQ